MCDCPVCHKALPETQKRHYGMVYPSAVPPQNRIQGYNPAATGPSGGGAAAAMAASQSTTMALAGISFTRADPNAVLSNKPKSTPASASKRLYHDLMLAPSKIVGENNSNVHGNTTRTSNGPATTQAGLEERIGGAGTKLEQKWDKETEDMMELFDEMREQVQHYRVAFSESNPTASPSSKQPQHGAIAAGAATMAPPTPAIPLGATREVDAYESPVAKRARTILGSVQEDIRNVKKVVEAAELEAMTHLREHRKAKRPVFLQGDDRIGDSDEDEDLFDSDDMLLRCEETLPAVKSKDALPAPDSEDYRQMIILAWQETALLRETARIINRKARELCEKRMIKE